MGTDAGTEILFFLFLLVLGVLLILGLLLVYRGGRALARTLYPAFGPEPLHRLVGLGVAALVFRDSLSYLVGSPIRFLFLFFWDVPRRLLEAWRVPCKPGNGCRIELVTKLWSGTGQGLHEAAQASGLAGYPISKLILFLVLWALAGQFLGWIWRTMSTGQSLLDPPMLSWVRNIAKDTWRKLTLFVVLAFGAFLGVATIVAIPAMEPSESLGKESAADFQQRLGSQAMSDEQIEKEFPVDLGLRDPFPDLRLSARRRLKVEPAAAPPPAAPVPAAPPPAAPSPPSPHAPPAAAGVQAAGGAVSEAAEIKTPAGPPVFASFVLSRIDAFASERQQALRVWPRARKEALAQKTRAQEQARNLYETAESNLKSGREKRAFVTRILDWHQARQDVLNSGLRECRSRIENVSLAFDGLSTSVQSALDQDDQNLLTTLATLPSGYGPGILCPIALGPPPPPSPPRGGELGYYAPFSRWLVDTDSMDLVLITGMLGFGFLGAAVSTFVRNTRNTAQDPIHDVTGVLLRGITAAMVVFLTVKGGLAVFALEGSNPNPYVLLATCFIAAVYSEDAWKGVRERWLPEERRPVEEEKEKKDEEVPPGS